MVLFLSDILKGKILGYGFDGHIHPEEIFALPVILSEPIKFEGHVSQNGEKLKVRAHVSFDGRFFCHRCMMETERFFEFDFSHTLVQIDYRYDPLWEFARKKNDEVKCLCEQVDITDVLTEDILEAMPRKLLCSEDCEGIFGW
ncbi:MAG: hypothetical protein IJH80_09235 [Ruminococcus sp.]|nr:hypothetical protein [Ruminococcus sp.]MBQ7070402.1 hypothetical protein [Ruminococcus sp.]